MTTYSFKAIWDALYNKMLEIKNVRIWEVYNHDIKIENWVNLPAIIITPTNGTIWFLDSCWYENNMYYSIRVIDRIQDWIDNVESNMREIADIVITKLKELWTITRTNNDWYTVSCEFTYQRWFVDTQEPLRVFEVECKYKAVET